MKRDVLTFLPLLVLYLLLVVLLSSPAFEGDEGSYVGYAHRLVPGSHSPPEVSTLWWGPGYPIVLAPFATLKLPWLTAKLLNAFLLFGAVVYFHRTMGLYIERRHATILALLFGLYPPLMREVHQLLSESLALFLVCGFMFHWCRTYRGAARPWFHMSAAAFYLGYLALTKVFFGYVISVGLLFFLVLYLWRRRDMAKTAVCIYMMALVLCMPYLLYTYSVTGKAFCWGTSGGMSLYWMSTSYGPGEHGSWYSFRNVEELPELTPHRAFFGTLSGLPEAAMDSAFRQRAISNIAHHPKTYLSNWAANVGRMVFSYPFSYTTQKLSTYFYILPNMFLAVLSALSIYPALLRRRLIPFEVFAVLFFAMVALGGTSLLSAYERQFRPLVPVLLLWLSFVYFRILKIAVCSDTELQQGTSCGSDTPASTLNKGYTVKE